MKDITSLEDQMKGQCTFEFHDGSRFCVSEKAVDTYGLAGVLRMHAPDYDPGPPLPVYQHGRMVGTLSPLWNARSARNTMLYVPRNGDFRREGDRWIADPMLGPGDLLHAGVNMIDKPEW